jgi:hypothetical protein
MENDDHEIEDHEDEYQKNVTMETMKIMIDVVLLVKMKSVEMEL